MTTQIIINCFISASIFSLVSLSFTVIYSVNGFFHFAHAIIFTLGAYFSLLFNKVLGLPLGVSIPLAIILSIALGCAMELFVYKPLRNKNAPPMVMLLASLGIYIFLQNLISLLFGDDTKSIRTGVIKEGLNIFGARITPIQIAIIITAIIITILLILFLTKTKTGKSMRAVASDARLSDITGIKSDRIILISYIIGSGMAALAGILVAMDVDMTPTMGMNALMMGVVAMIIGGVNSIPGIICGALLLGIAQNLGAWYIGSQWQEAIAFVVLLIFLIFRPQGFFGKKTKKIGI